MTDEYLEAIKARYEALTLGWRLNEDGVVIDADGCYVAQADDEAVREFIAHARTDVPSLVAEVERCVKVIRAIISASDNCQGHAGCEHSMKPWFDARELLYQFDNDEEALADLRSRASHERYRE